VRTVVKEAFQPPKDRENRVKEAILASQDRENSVKETHSSLPD